MKRPLAVTCLVFLTAAGGAEMKAKPPMLDSAWTLILDPDNRGKREEWAVRGFPAVTPNTTVRVPSVWQRRLPDYQGPAFYETTFKLPREAGPCVILSVGSANYRAEGWLNGKPVGSHDGGYTPFEWDLTSAALPGGENRLVIRVVHSPAGADVEGVGLTRTPTSKETWYFPYAGITGPVAIRYAPDPRLENITIIPLEKLDQILVRTRLTGTGTRPFSGQLTLNVGDRRAKTPLKIPAGTKSWEVEQVFPLRGIKRWTLEKPAVYQLAATLSVKQRVLETRFARFGMRTVDFKDGWLFINGRQIQVRGVLLQPNWPVTFAQPPDKKFAIRELEQIKAAGFNLVRSHLKPLNDDQLEWCDEHGLLVYEETPVAWMSEDDPEQCFRTAGREAEEMISAHRNHPSIVLWGISNENGRFAGEAGTRLLAACAGLDPTRPAIDVSGWSMNIYPQGGWMNETHLLRPKAARPEFIEDHHHYLRAPVGRAEYGILRFLGDPDRMPSYEAAGYGPAGKETAWKQRLKGYTKGIFVSEFGVGGLPDLAAVVKGYQGFRSQENADAERRKDGPLPASATRLADEEYYGKINAIFQEEFARHEMSAEFGSATGFISACQFQQTTGVRRQIEAMRQNPRVSGYILTQWNDASWECDAGVVDVWRNPKPVARELKRLNAPWLLLLKPEKRIVPPGKPASVTVGILGPGPLPRAAKLEYALAGPGDAPNAKVKWETLRRQTGAEWIISLPPLSVRGRWTVRVRLKRAGKVLASAEDALFAESFEESSPQSFGLIGESHEITAAFGDWIIPPEAANVLIASRPALLKWAELFNLFAGAGTGKKVIFTDLDQPDVDAINSIPKLPWKLSLTKTMCTFQGYFHYFSRDRFSVGLPGVGPAEPGKFLAGEPYADYLPVWSLPELAGSIIRAGACGTDRLGFESEEAKLAHMRGWHTDIMEVPYGKGRIVFCQYRLTPYLTEPLARQLFYRLLAI